MDVNVVVEQNTNDFVLVTDGPVVFAFGARDADDLWERATTEQGDIMGDAKVVLSFEHLPDNVAPTAYGDPVIGQVAKLVGYVSMADAANDDDLGFRGKEITLLDDTTENGDAQISIPLRNAVLVRACF